MFREIKKEELEEDEQGVLPKSWFDVLVAAFTKKPFGKDVVIQWRDPLSSMPETCVNILFIVIKDGRKFQCFGHRTADGYWPRGTYLNHGIKIPSGYRVSPEDVLCWAEYPVSGRL